MNMHNNTQFRGIASVRAEMDPAAIRAAVENIHSSFAAFRDRNDQRVASIEAAVNGMAESVAGVRLNGGSDVHPGAGVRLPGFGAPAITGPAREEFLNAMRGMPSASMTSQSGPDGGFTVTPVIDTTIDALMRNASVMRSLARIVMITSGNTWQKVIGTSGTQSGWVGEEETRTDTNSPKLGMVSIGPEELYAMPELTNALIEDSGFDLLSFLTEDVTSEFALQEGMAFVSGNGVRRPMGFMSYAKASTADAARAFGTLQYVPSGVAGSFNADNLHDMLTALRPVYRSGDGVAWIMNSATANVVRKFKDGQGNYLWSASIIPGQPDRLLGYPVAIDEAMPDVAAGAYPLAFGNWRRGYAIVDKPGLRLIADRVTKKGWTKMYFSRRTGGGVTDSNAIKLLKIAVS